MSKGYLSFVKPELPLEVAEHGWRVHCGRRQCWLIKAGGSINPAPLQLRTRHRAPFIIQKIALTYFDRKFSPVSWIKAVENLFWIVLKIFKFMNNHKSMLSSLILLKVGGVLMAWSSKWCFSVPAVVNSHFSDFPRARKQELNSKWSFIGSRKCTFSNYLFNIAQVLFCFYNKMQECSHVVVLKLAKLLEVEPKFDQDLFINSCFLISVLDSAIM